MTSRQKLTQAGFTLVELAIVLLIVGLLIAGILKGQELIENSRMTATISQSKSYEAAVNTFRDSYGALPGDLLGATTRVPGCTTAVACQAGDGNAQIGTVAPGVALTALTDERAQFWLHLALANLITGVVPDYSTGSGAAVGFGSTLPAGRVGGGFIPGFASGAAAVGAAPAGTTSGHFLVLQGAPGTAADAANAGSMTAARASQLDLKLDDGKPGTGDVVGIGNGTGCYTAATANGNYQVATGLGRVCSPAIRVIN